MTLWPNSLTNKIALLILVLAVAFRLAVPAYVELMCVNGKDALSNACLLAGSMRE